MNNLSQTEFKQLRNLVNKVNEKLPYITITINEYEPDHLYPVVTFNDDQIYYTIFRFFYDEFKDRESDLEFNTIAIVTDTIKEILKTNDSDKLFNMILDELISREKAKSKTWSKDIDLVIIAKKHEELYHILDYYKYTGKIKPTSRSEIDNIFIEGLVMFLKLKRFDIKNIKSLKIVNSAYIGIIGMLVIKTHDDKTILIFDAIKKREKELYKELMTKL